MFKSMSFWIVLVLTAATSVAGCGSPLAGRWHGIADVGPVQALPIKVALAQDGLSGQVSMAEEGGVWRTWTLCSVQRTGRSFELQYDRGQPECQAGSGSDRRRLVGTVGEGLLFGEVQGAAGKLGFFRAFAVEPD